MKVIAWSLLAGCLSLHSQTNELHVGDRPPPLAFQTLLQAPSGTVANWQSLTGKVVVLEFWATWCIPCIRALPHLNEMSDALKDSPVQFIAVCDEKPEVIASFLKKHPLHAWIGVDAGKSTFSSYGVSGIPLTVVIDRTGKIAAVTTPEDLTESQLKDLVIGKPLAVAPKKLRNSFSFRPGELPESENDHPSLFRLLIRPSETVNSGWGGSGGKFTFIGSTITNMLCAAYGVDESRLFPSFELPDARFDAVVNVPAQRSGNGRDWLRMAVNTTFDIVSRRETRVLDTLVLTVTDPSAPHLSVSQSAGASSSHSDTDAGVVQSLNMPISSIVATLQGLLKKPVIDQTGLTNRYDWDLKWNAKSPSEQSSDGLLKAVRQQLGLDLTPAMHPVEVIIVDKAE